MDAEGGGRIIAAARDACYALPPDKLHAEVATQLTQSG